MPTEADPTAVVIAAEPDEGIIVRRGLWRLQMQWVENEVPWRLLERAKSESERPPGWIDTARDWYGLRENSAVSVQRDSGNACLRATNDNVDTFGWVYSAPANVEATTSYIAAGRVKSIDAKASVARIERERKGRIRHEIGRRSGLAGLDVVRGLRAILWPVDHGQAIPRRDPSRRECRIRRLITCEDCPPPF